MRVLVTGATGLIGSALCDALLARGEEVVGLSRDPARARSTNPTASWHAWDAANERPPAAAFEGVDAVVNLIGENINQRLTDEAKERIRDEPRAGDEEPRRRDARAPRRHPRRSSASRDRLLRRPRRGDRRRVDPAAEGFLAQIVRRVGGRGAAAARRRRAGGGLPHRARPRPRGRPAQAAACSRSSSASAGRSPEGDQYMPWIHLDDEVRSDPLGTRQREASAGSSTRRRRTRSPTASSRRRSAGPAPARRCSPSRASHWSPSAARSSTEQIVASFRVIPRRALDLGYAFRFSELDPALRDLVG